MTKPALCLIEPGGVSGGEVHDESRMVCQPLPHLGVFMSAVVVCNDMHIQFSRDALVDLLEKGKEFLVAMSGFAVGQHGAACNVQGRKERRCAVAEVVMRDSFHIPQTHGQYRLTSFKGLDL